MAMWSHGTLASAWRTWKAAWRDGLAGTAADVQYWGRLQDNAWIAWREVGGAVGASGWTHARESLGGPGGQVRRTGIAALFVLLVLDG
jgi:hypothetical protein